MENLKWGDFKAQLQPYPVKHLQLRYNGDNWVDASYHITEIKLAAITAVDCGGVMNNWAEVIVQLWEPGDKQQERAMTVGKALSIIELVEKTLIIDTDATVKIEFGNARFDTRQMYPADILVDADNLIIDLRGDKTQCKAIDRGGSCGIPGNSDECCLPAKPKTQLVNLASEGASCTTGSGCC